MTMHDANFSDPFDVTAGKNMRLGLGVRRKTREAIMPNSPPLKSLISIEKEDGGYKKARKHRGLKKRSRGEKSKVKESESGKTHNKEQVKSCGQYEEEFVSSSSDDDFPNVAPSDEQVMKLMHSAEIKSESETESFSIHHKKAVSNILKPSSEETLEHQGNKPFSPFADLDVEREWTPDYNFGNARLRRQYLAEKNIYGERPTKAQLELNKILGVRDPLTAWTLSPEEVEELFRPPPWTLL